MKEQKCNTCNKTKPISDFEWQKNRPKPRKKCKKCRHKERDYEKEYAYRNSKRKEKYWKDPDAARRSWEKHKYGVCKEDFSYSCCWVCGSQERLCIDHCHTTGQVRGLLCTKCNSAIGMFEDNTDNLQRAIEYLNQSPHFQLNWSSYPKEW